MSNVFIPWGLVRDVLSRLPVKSLIRFKCVSKSWYITIDDAEFIKTNAKRSELTESNMKLIAHGFYNRVYKLYALDSNFRESFDVKSMEEINYSSIMHYCGYKIEFAGSCNGLVCLVYLKEKEDIIVLWNPSTRKHLQLPICSKQYRTLTLNDTCVHGFGYDEVTDDYKVIRLVRYRDKYRQQTSSEYYIYNLKSNEWRRFKDFAYGNLSLVCNGVLANGALHWLLKDGSILAFNVATEAFELLPCPETSIENALLCVTVPVVARCQNLILVSYHWSDREIWEMKSYGIKDSWTKLSSDLSTLMPMVGYDDVVICDFQKQFIRKLKLPVGAENVKACLYFESLVRLDAGEKAQAET